MAEYQGVFFGPSVAAAKGAACQAAETFDADTDELARLRMDALRRGRRDRRQGFELWQGSRLVHRCAPRVGGEIATDSPHREGEACHER